jgi:hypothetical protein
MATDDSGLDTHEVPPLERTAFFDIDTDYGYVRIDQSVGDQRLYTPAEARDVAEAIMDAADEAQRE